MVAKKYKLPIKDFPRNSKTVYRGELFTIKAVYNNLPIYRIGVICKAKIFKKAVLRNKLKRAVFDALHPLTKKKVDESRGMDLLINLNAPIINLTIKEIKSKLNDIQFIQRIT